MLGRDDQQKGSDLREKRKTRLPEIPSPRVPDLSFSRWRQCYKSRGSCLVYLASEVQKQSNAPVTGKTLATKVSKSHAMPPYVPGVNPPGMAADKCITALFYEIIYLKRFLSPIR